MHALHKTWRILRSRHGESLVETIVAFVVITIALLAFSAFAIAGSHLTAATTQSDSSTGAAMSSEESGTATITGGGISGSSGASVDVTIHGNNDGEIYSYEKKK